MAPSVSSSDVRSNDWNAEVSRALLELKERVAFLDEDGQRHFQILVEEIEELSHLRPRLFRWTRVNEWWSGKRLDLIWSRIHFAQLQLLAVAPLPVMRDLFEIVVEHCETLSVTDTARLRLIDLIQHRVIGSLSDENIGPALSWP